MHLTISNLHLPFYNPTEKISGIHWNSGGILLEFQLNERHFFPFEKDNSTGISTRFQWKLKQCFLRKTMSPQPSSFVGYIENYGIKLWRPFNQQYSMGLNGHRPKWLWAEMVMDWNGYWPK